MNNQRGKLCRFYYEGEISVGIEKRKEGAAKCKFEQFHSS